MGAIITQIFQLRNYSTEMLNKSLKIGTSVELSLIWTQSVWLQASHSEPLMLHCLSRYKWEFNLELSHQKIVLVNQVNNYR